MTDDTTDSTAFDEAVNEYMERLRAGTQPTMEEYLARLPAFADDIRQIFPTLALLEDAGSLDLPPFGRFGISGSAATR